MTHISDRTKNLGTETAFDVLAEVNSLVAKGKEVVSFCIGQPDFDTPDNIKYAAINAITRGKTGYTASAGILPLREAIAKHLSNSRKIPVNPDSVVVANGAKPFIMHTIVSVTDYGKGDEVLYPNPGFPIYEAQILAQGAVPVPLPLLERKGFGFDINDLKRKVNEKTRLLILNSPQNPTGSVLSRMELEQIADIVSGYDDLWVYSDEVYSKLFYAGEFQSIASISNMQEKTIIVDGLSKTYAMTGWRLGYASNKKLAPYLTRWVTNTTSCAAHPTQYAALEAITGSQKKSEKMMQTFKMRRNLIVDGLNQIEGITCFTPGGAFYVWPNVTTACEIVGAENSEEFRKRLLYEAGVAVLADIHFGQQVEGEGQHIRLSYATSNDNIKEGLRRIADYINNYRK
jgi:aspartate/methionine/tyrosine aminotransferase